MSEIQRTGGIISLTYTEDDFADLPERIFYRVLFSIPNLLAYSAIGFGIYCLGQWLGGQL